MSTGFLKSGFPFPRSLPEGTSRFRSSRTTVTRNSNRKQRKNHAGLLNRPSAGGFRKGPRWGDPFFLAYALARPLANLNFRLILFSLAPTAPSIAFFHRRIV